MKTIIGLTGSYCSGKNQAAFIMASDGFDVIDVDTLGHRALERSTKKLVSTFGSDILKADGSIDRKKLGSILFSSSEKLHLHESIVHPIMLELLDEEIAKSDRICINAALLYRFPQAKECNLIIELKAPFFERIRRGKSRDHLAAMDVVKRIISQRYLWKLRPYPTPPVVFIRNNGDLDELRLRVEAVLSHASLLGNGAGA